jgi:UPF0755 protein
MRTNTVAKATIAVIAMLFLGAAICVGVLLVASGGNVNDFVQTQLARFRLSSQQEMLDRPTGTDGTPIRFVIASGESPRSIAQNLLAQGLIADADIFVDYVRSENLDVQLEAGTFFLYRTESTRQIAQALTDSASSQFIFSIIEGERIEEIAFNRVDSNRFFDFSGAEFFAVVGPGTLQNSVFAQRVGLPSGASLEGFLFPDTYQLPAAVTPIMLRDILTEQFLARITDDLQQAAQQQGLSLYEVVTLASIIQREAVRVDEMPAISGVYRNRLAIGMKLDADPTVQYGMGFQNGTWWPQLTVADYQNVLSPYNTYRSIGLPPGPIASPGLSAIRAALFPTQSDFYYFRARCDGSGYHNFARTFEEHLTNAC